MPPGYLALVARLLPLRLAHRPQRPRQSGYLSGRPFTIYLFPLLDYKYEVATATASCRRWTQKMAGGLRPLARSGRC